MNEKSKKVLAAQGAGVVQALSWIGGAIFGDHEDVIDDIAARGDGAPRTERGGGAALPPRAAPRAAFATPARPRRAPAAKPEPEVITVEGVLVEDEDE